MQFFKNGIVVKNSKIPERLSWFINIRAITLWPFMIWRDEPDERTINHERIHIRQQLELLVLPFYILYGAFWIYHRAKGLSSSEAYHALPFELEAYDNDGDVDYLGKRKLFAWTKYIR